MIKSNLHMLMAQKKLKVIDVVRATGISKSTMHKIYHEQTSRIDFETIDKLCEFFEVDVGDIFYYEANENAEKAE